MENLVALTYEEIDNNFLEKTLKSDGMVFIRLSSRQAKVFINFYEKNKKIEKYKFSSPIWIVRKINLISAFYSLIKTCIFHIRLVELEAFVTVNKVRCTWEIQPNGEYVLIFS